MPQQSTRRAMTQIRVSSMLRPAFQKASAFGAPFLSVSVFHRVVYRS
jgi:hypothetical protein